jgi:transcriptional regulator with XRE-family HTH domain
VSSLTIGEALVARRDQLGLDKGRAADLIGMSRTTYGAYEANRQRPSVNVFPALAEFLDVAMEEFLDLYGATMILAARPALQRVMSMPADTAAPVHPQPREPTESSVTALAAPAPSAYGVVEHQKDPKQKKGAKHKRSKKQGKKH